MGNKVLPRKLTHKQEKFAQAIVDGYGQSEAYKLACDTSNMLPATVSNSAYKLVHHGEIAARISERRQVVASELMATRIWTAEKLIEEAETNLYAAREARQFGPANKSLEIISRLISNPRSAGREIPRITTVIYNLSAGKAMDGDEAGIVDAKG